jgi:hypothetical protein
MGDELRDLAWVGRGIWSSEGGTSDSLVILELTPRF